MRALPQERLEIWQFLQFLEKEILKDDHRGQKIKGAIRIDNENEGEELPSLERMQVILEELASDGVLEYEDNEEKFNFGIFWYDIVIFQPQFRRLYDEFFQNFQETKSLLLLHFQKYGQELFPHHKKADFVSKKDLEMIMETARQSVKSPSNFFFSINDYVDALYNSINGYKITQGFLNDEGKALFEVFYEAREKVYEDCMHLHTFFQKLLKKLQKGKFGDDVTDAFAGDIQEWISEVNISHHCHKKEHIDVLSMALELEDLLNFIFSHEKIDSEKFEKMKKEIQKALEKIGFFVIGSVSSLKEAFSQSLTSSGEESKTYVMPSVLPMMNKYDDFSDREFFQNTFILSLNHYRKILHTLVESSKNSRWSAWENLFLVFALLKMKTFPDSYFEDSGIRSKISIPEGQLPNLKILRRDFAILMDNKKQDLFTKAFEIDEYMRHLQKVHFYVCSQLEEELRIEEPGKPLLQQNLQLNELEIDIENKCLINNQTKQEKDISGAHYVFLKVLIDARGGLVSYSEIAEKMETVSKLTEKEVMDRKSNFIRMLKDNLQISDTTCKELIRGKKGYRISKNIFTKN